MRVEAEGDPFKHLSRRTHPGAEGSRVCRSLVMRMVRGVGHRLGIHQPAEEQEADSQAHSDGSPKRFVHHKHRANSSQMGADCQATTNASHLYRIRSRIAVYCCILTN